MSRKKPEPKTWRKVVMIETGDNYISEIAYHTSISYGSYTGRSVEQKVFETADPKTVSLVTSLYEKETEIKRLQSIIQGYKEATEKVMVG